MRTYSGEFYLRKDFGFIDLGIPAAVGIPTVAVYEVLRRYIWRSTTTGNGKARKAYQNGKLTSKVSQTNIGLLLGVCRQNVNKHIKTLKDMGWLDTQGKDDELVYILGERVLTSTGDKAEVFYADSCCVAAATHVHDEAVKAGLEGYSNLPIPKRVEMVKDFLGMRKGRTVSQKRTPGVAKDDHETGGVSQKATENIENPTETTSPPGIEIEKVNSAALRTEEIGDSPSLTTAPLLEEDQGLPSTVEKSGNGGHKGEPLDKATRLLLARQAIVDGREKQVASSSAKESRKPRGKLARENESKYGPLAKAWAKAFKKAFPDAPIATKWGGKEYGQAKQLDQKYKRPQVISGMEYIIANWEAITTRFKKSSAFPTIGFLLSFHDQLIPEAAKWEEIRGVKEEMDAWWRDNPKKLPPRKLKSAYESNRKAMESLGLI